MKEVYLSLGSNLGNRQQFLQNAISALKEKVAVLTFSSVYKTKPWGNKAQPEFLNMCVKCQTSLSPEDVLELIQGIEKDLGRTHQEKWGPREIDIDLLFYGSEISNSPKLNIPHPYLTQRAFVLIPLAEIAPDFIHPVLNQTVKSLAEKVGSTGVTRLK